MWPGVRAGPGIGPTGRDVEGLCPTKPGRTARAQVTGRSYLAGEGAWTADPGEGGRGGRGATLRWLCSELHLANSQLHTRRGRREPRSPDPGKEPG